MESLDGISRPDAFNIGRSRRSHPEYLALRRNQSRSAMAAAPVKPKRNKFIHNRKIYRLQRLAPPLTLLQKPAEKLIPHQKLPVRSLPISLLIPEARTPSENAVWGERA